MEKEHQPDSMATITMKPEYPPSEYSASSEPPPAYRQRVSNSVQIARIAAVSVVAASFILGAFILASSWVTARASCHQLEQFDAMLDKELALEGRAYGNDGLMPDEPLPIGNAHALHAAPPTVSQPSPPPASPAANQLGEDALNHAESKIDEDRLQKIDDVKSEAPNNDESSESDSSAEDDDDLDAMRPVFKVPIHFDLDELAGAFLANNQKGRMNCVVEKRHDEPMERRFPFNILGAFAPRSAQAERVAIICHGGDEPRPMIPDPQSQVFAFPLSGPVRLPLRPQPERNGPAQEPRMPPFASMPQHRPMPFPLPMPWDSSEEQMGGPREMGMGGPREMQMGGPREMHMSGPREMQMGGPREMRIHVQRVIAIPAPHNMPPQNMPSQNMPPQNMLPQNMPSQNMPPPPETMGPFAPPPPPPQNDQNEQSTILHQFVPQSAPTQELEQPEVQKMQMDGTPVQMNLPWGLTPEDLHAIHRSAEQASQQRHSQQQIDNDMQEMKTIVNTLAAAAEAEAEAQAQAESQGQEEQPGVMTAPQSPRAPRTLLLPQDMPMEERPHYMQPRSVRSVDALLHREKRVKRCACDCN